MQLDGQTPIGIRALANSTTASGHELIGGNYKVDFSRLSDDENNLVWLAGRRLYRSGQARTPKEVADYLRRYGTLFNEINGLPQIFFRFDGGREELATGEYATAGLFYLGYLNLKEEERRRVITDSISTIYSSGGGEVGPGELRPVDTADGVALYPLSRDRLAFSSGCLQTQVCDSSEIGGSDEVQCATKAGSTTVCSRLFEQPACAAADGGVQEEMSGFLANIQTCDCVPDRVETKERATTGLKQPRSHIPVADGDAPKKTRTRFGSGRRGFKLPARNADDGTGGAPSSERPKITAKSYIGKARAILKPWTPKQLFWTDVEWVAAAVQHICQYRDKMPTPEQEPAYSGVRESYLALEKWAEDEGSRIDKERVLAEICWTFHDFEKLLEDFLLHCF